jgi:hypothetical protein
MVDSLLGRWLFSVLSASSQPREPLGDELLGAWPGDSAEPFTVVWYVLNLLAHQVSVKDNDRIGKLVHAAAGSIDDRHDIDEAWIASTARVVLGDREASLPDISPDAMAVMCAGLCAVLVRQESVTDQALEAAISRAERASVQQGIDLP